MGSTTYLRELEAALAAFTTNRTEPLSQMLQLLLGTIQDQAAQIRRLEDIVTARLVSLSATCALQPLHCRSDPTDTALADTQQQIVQLQAALQKQQQQQDSNVGRSAAGRLQLVKSRLTEPEQAAQQLQKRIGLSPHSKSRSKQASLAANAAGATRSTVPRAGQLATTADAPASSSTVISRLQRMERRLDCLAGLAASNQEGLQSASIGLQELRTGVDRQLASMQTDIKQAITLATSTFRVEMQAFASSKAAEVSQQLGQKLEGLYSRLDICSSTCQELNAAGRLPTIDQHMSAVQDAFSGQLIALQRQVDKLQIQADELSEVKADTKMLAQYTEQVGDVFQQSSALVAESAQSGLLELAQQQQQLDIFVQSIAASKADSTTLQQHQQQCQQQLQDLQRPLATLHAAAADAVAAAHAAGTAAECVEGLRMDLADLQGAVAALQATTAGLEITGSNSANQLQEQSQQLQLLASNHHMLQQQLLALSNQVDPAAAALLAAAAAGDQSVTTFQPLGIPWSADGLGSLIAAGSQQHSNSSSGSAAIGSDAHVDWRSWLTSSYLAAASKVQQSSKSHRIAGWDSTGGKRPTASVAENTSKALLQEAAASVRQAGEVVYSNGTPIDAQACSAAAVPSGEGSIVDEASAQGVLRHLPVAVRLLRLEGSVQQLGSMMAAKVNGDLFSCSGDLQAVHARLESALCSLHGVSRRNMTRLEDKVSMLTRASVSLAKALDARPTNKQLQHDLQQALVQATDAAHTTSAATSRSMMQPLQQQLDAVVADMKAAKAQLQDASKELNQLQAALVGFDLNLQQQAQQIHQQVTRHLHDSQQNMMQQLESVSRAAAAQTLKAVSHQVAVVDAEAAVDKRLTVLESQVVVVTAELDRLHCHATLAAQVQDKHSTVLSALQAAITAQGNKATADTQQLRAEFRQAFADARAAQTGFQEGDTGRISALEASVTGQATALSSSARLVASLPSQQQLRGSQATAR